MEAGPSRAGELAELWATCAWLAVDCQSVIAMRMMGLGGAWPLPRGEAGRMLCEKNVAFAEAMEAGTRSVLSFQLPDRVVTATLAPLSARVRANRHRLARRNPIFCPVADLERRKEPDA